MSTNLAINQPLPPSRVERLRWKIIEAPQEVCIERARHLTEAMCLHWDKPPLTRMSLAFEHILNHISVIIREDEIIVGCRTSKLKGAPCFRKTSRCGLRETWKISINGYCNGH